CQHGYGIPFTV
nr:immunoglobulin light chain junction region [Macaca mulatta]MPN99857.1 immunoglobulin light chain junction region [Macaca mulatta]MPO00042.1 immunoglobulin light chain junction region [Macaca mulatta]MPO00940.1 immunoglobulin light chain junction region [Macaca mulatta]MPO02067.1 immunoglobulin light chain junction region [Macaca mulatta]